MFHFDGGLFLTRAQLAVDVRRRQPRGFVSHAHTDHIARHELALATPATAAIYHHRLGSRYRVQEMPFREPIEFGGLRLSTYPAGHILGSAMLLAEDGDASLLYTGDFKLDPSATSEAAELPHADILVMECTFGRPRYQLPPRDETVAQLLELVQSTLAEGRTPVIHAYPLGKAQEVTKLLTDAGTPVLQHPAIYAISRIYQEFGVDLGDVDIFKPSPSGRGKDKKPPLPSGEGRGEGFSGHALITLPRSARGFRLPGLDKEKTVSITATGWAMDPSTKYRLGVDHAIPLSDHADFEQLIEAVRRVEPREIYCTHGTDEFVDHLRDLGFNAHPLNPPAQRKLF